MKRIIVATALSLALASSFSWADTNNKATKTVTSTLKSSTGEQVRELDAVSEEGFNAMRTIQYARLAIFSGNTELANKLNTEAAALLNDDSVEWSKFVKEATGSKVIKGEQYIVINASIAIDENYVVTPEKQPIIDKANAKIKSGDEEGALEELRLAGIAVNETQYLMPLNFTKKAVADAGKLLKDGKYYEANLALLNAEQAVIVDSVTLIQGH